MLRRQPSAGSRPVDDALPTVQHQCCSAEVVHVLVDESGDKMTDVDDRIPDSSATVWSGLRSEGVWVARSEVPRSLGQTSWADDVDPNVVGSPLFGRDPVSPLMASFAIT